MTYLQKDLNSSRKSSYKTLLPAEGNEQERDETTTAKIKALESDLANLGDGFTINDDIRRKHDYFESLLKQNSIDPYGLPSGDRI